MSANKIEIEADIYRTLRFFHQDGEVFEVCAINPHVTQSALWSGGRVFGKDKIVAGWFDNLQAACEFIAKLDAMGCEGIYHTPNPCNDGLLSRAGNRLVANVSRTTNDDITRVMWLLIDIDPKRPSGISSTPMELECALKATRSIKDFLTVEGFGAPADSLSGNGGHLAYPVNLPNDRETSELFKGFVAALDWKFGGDVGGGIKLEVDKKVFNSARLFKVYGTWARKGENTQARPHRLSKILELPEAREEVSAEQIKAVMEKLAAEAPEYVPGQYSGKKRTQLRVVGGKSREWDGGQQKPMDVEGYLEHYGRAVVRVKDHGGSTLYVLKECVFDSSHSGGEAAVGVTDEGKLFYQCFHNSCSERTWAEAREIISGDDSMAQWIPDFKPAKRGPGRPRKDSGEEFVPIDERTVFHNESGKLLKHKKAAETMLPYLQNLLYDATSDQWMGWSDDNLYWSEINQRIALRMIDQTISTMATGLDYNKSFRDGILDQLAVMLDWDTDRQPDNAIPFSNGVLLLESMELIEHSRRHRFTWKLPYPYDPNATCEPVIEWLKTVVEREDQVEIVRAYMNAILLGKANIQKFMELIGPGGAGKGTLTRLCIAMVGKENCVATELKHLENNKFETQRIYGKRLVVISDAEKYSGSIEVLKNMTGDDYIRYERKYRDAGQDFKFGGMVLISANEYISSSDYTSGLQRRRITLRFMHQIESRYRDPNFENQLHHHLSGLVNWSLTMRDDEVREKLIETDASIVKTIQETNPLADWTHQYLVYHADHQYGIMVESRVGLVERDPASKQIINSSEFLYPCYVKWCEQAGQSVMSAKRFSNLLRDLLCYQLKLPNVRRRKKMNGSVFESIGIRKLNEPHERFPSPLAAYATTIGVTMYDDLEGVGTKKRCDNCSAYQPSDFKKGFCCNASGGESDVRAPTDGSSCAMFERVMH